MKSLRGVWLFVTPWTAAYQAPPSMGFSRQEYWSGVPLLVIRKMQIKTTRHHLTHEFQPPHTSHTTHIVKKMNNNTCWHACRKKGYTWVLLVGFEIGITIIQNSMKKPEKKLKLTYYDAGILLLEIYPKETKILTWKYIFTLIFIPALFIIPKTW